MTQSLLFLFSYACILTFMQIKLFGNFIFFSLNPYLDETLDRMRTNDQVSLDVVHHDCFVAPSKSTDYKF